MSLSCSIIYRWFGIAIVTTFKKTMPSTGLITISQRLRGIDEDGSEIDGLSAKLGDSFDKIGVAIEDSNGELRSTYDIMSDYAKIYPTLTSEQQQYYAELAAGKHQVNVFNAIVQQMSDVKNAVEQSIDSVGSAANENEIYRQSIAGLKNEFSSQFEMLSKETIDDEWLKNLISSGTSFLKVLTNIVEQDDLVSVAISGITDIIKGLASALESISDNDGMASLMKLLLTYGTIKKGIDIFQSFRNTKDTLSAVEKFFKNANSGNIQMKSGFLQVGDAEEKAAGGIKNFISQMAELKSSGMSTADILKTGFSTIGESISGVLIAHPVAAALTAFTGILAVASATAPNLSKYKLYYSSGTPKAKDDLAFMDDTNGKLNLGSEAMITEKGILGNWGGNVIFSKDQTQALYNMSNGIFPGMDQMIKNVKANAAPVNITNNVSQGDINVHYDSLVTVQGDVSKDMFPGIQKMAKESFEYTIKELKKANRAMH